MTVKANRRENLRLLAQALGGVAELAHFLEKSPSQISHLVGNYLNKNIGDKLAAEIEKKFAKPAGWLDGNYAGLETEVIATAIPPANCHRVPFLQPKEVSNWVLHPQKRLTGNEDYPYLYTSTAISPAAYAFQLQTDSMQASGNISFPQGAIVIVDPDIHLKNNAFAVIRLEYEIEPLLRQIINIKNVTYLQALNKRYPLIKFKEQFLYCGSVKEVIVERSKW